MKQKNILAENMRRFGTKNLNEQPDDQVSNMYGKSQYGDGFASAEKASYDNVWDDMASAAEELADALDTPHIKQLPIIRHAITQLKKWTDAKKPAPLAVYMLVDEAPALLDAMQVKSKKAWSEMRSHWGGIVDAIADEDEDDYVTENEPDANDTF